MAVLLDTDGDHAIDQGFLLTTDLPMHDRPRAHFAGGEASSSRTATCALTYDKKVFDL